MIHHESPLTDGARQCRTCSSSSIRSIVAAGLVIAVTLFSMIWTVLVVLHSTEPGLAEEHFCRQNKFLKQRRGREDILDDVTSICGSTIVLPYSVHELERPLRGAYVAQAMAGAVLVAAGLPALVGLLRGQRWPLLVWAAAVGLWWAALLGSAAALYPFGYPVFVPMLAGSATACLLAACLALLCGLCQSDGGQHSPEFELVRRDPEKGRLFSESSDEGINISDDSIADESQAFL